MVTVSGNPNSTNPTNPTNPTTVVNLSTYSAYMPRMQTTTIKAHRYYLTESQWIRYRSSVQIQCAYAVQ